MKNNSKVSGMAVFLEYLNIADKQTDVRRVTSRILVQALKLFREEPISAQTLCGLMECSLVEDVPA